MCCGYTTKAFFLLESLAQVTTDSKHRRVALEIPKSLRCFPVAGALFSSLLTDVPMIQRVLYMLYIPRKSIPSNRVDKSRIRFWLCNAKRVPWRSLISWSEGRLAVSDSWGMPGDHRSGSARSRQSSQSSLPVFLNWSPNPKSVDSLSGQTQELPVTFPILSVALFPLVTSQTHFFLPFLGRRFSRFQLFFMMSLWNFIIADRVVELWRSGSLDRHHIPAAALPVEKNGKQKFLKCNHLTEQTTRARLSVRPFVGLFPARRENLTSLIRILL